MSKIKYLKISLTLSMFCLVLNLFAQTQSFTGTIADADTKEPLPYANIMVIGKQQGTISNSEGQFILSKEGISPMDTILISFIGYETIRVSVEKLKDSPFIYLHPSVLQMEEVQITKLSLTPEEIIEQIKKNYYKNYISTTTSHRVFLHKYSKTPLSKANKLILKKSDFTGLDKTTFEDLFKKLPPEFIEYYDAILELYHTDGKHKLVPIEGISLEEGSQQELIKEFENKLDDFIKDIEKSKEDKDIYYKFRTGILGYKFKDRDDEHSLIKENKKDPSHLTIKTDYVKYDILYLLKDYTNIKSKNWEFIHNTNKYDYVKKGITSFNEETVYEISFSPKKGGLFEGTMYVSTNTFAIVQLDFAFAKGKQSEKFQMFGIGHSTNFKKGRIIYEKGDKGYFIKYIYAQQQEAVSINRDFSIMKKRKRFLIDKELNEMKIEAHLSFTNDTYWELLVLDRKEVTGATFEKVQQPVMMKFKKEFAYTPEMWNNKTVITPGAELKKYKRK